MRTEPRPAPATQPALARRASDFEDSWPEESTVRIPRESMQALVYGNKGE